MSGDLRFHSKLGVWGINSGEKFRQAVLTNKVDASKLLHHLKSNTHKSSAQIGATVGKTALEAVRPARKVGSLGHNGEFVFVVGDDFG